MLKSGELKIYCDNIPSALESVLHGWVYGQVVIETEDIMRILDGLISGEITRGEASNWALSYRRLEDCGKLRYSPAKAREGIWGAILSLEVADMPTVDRPYLYDVDDFRKWREELRQYRDVDGKLQKMGG